MSGAPTDDGDRAYIYEVTPRGSDEWHTTVQRQHPRETAGDIETVEYRNVRTLVSADALRELVARWRGYSPEGVDTSGIAEGYTRAKRTCADELEAVIGDE